MSRNAGNGSVGDSMSVQAANKSARLKHVNRAGNTQAQMQAV
jgi:hypothetical protein